MLKSELGDRFTFDVTSESLQGVKRHFTISPFHRFSAAALQGRSQRWQQSRRERSRVDRKKDFASQIKSDSANEQSCGEWMRLGLRLGVLHPFLQVTIISRTEEELLYQRTHSGSGFVKSLKLLSAARLSYLRAAESEHKCCSVGLVGHATKTTHRS